MAELAMRMKTVHDAFRRELERLARAAERAGDDPRLVLRTAAGWEMFTTFLHIHHTAEDDALWPQARQALAGRPDGLALLDEMEAEHAALDPLLSAIDATLADREAAPERLGELLDALATGLREHLRHEEAEAMPLLESVLTEEQVRRFSEVNRDRIGAHAHRYLPWILDEADEETVARTLAGMPEPVRRAYHDEWRAAYAALDLWPVPARAS
ncbi:hemerythrin domain-containing protein [Thermomonospora catenispora]|uniref:hemerythrin domain-containing protein n=1 Tax=Thermomonospora catenispora TaxID=2493090 RepID=UPI0011233E2F|nr:hemerythrin domain-containing protein [Thermomonospora catenispora]TNY37829.1 hemerythrin domain-containing protein [Thermomonospora catenispora]